MTSVRPVRRDPRRQAVRARPRATTPRSSGRTAFASVIAPEDGKYIIQVRESAYAGNGGCLYRLHVGNFPRPTAIVPAGGKLGETVAVRWIGDAAGETTTKVTLPAAASGDFGLVPRTTRGSPPIPTRSALTPVRQRHRGRAQRRPGPRHAVRAADGPQRRDRQAGRRRPLRLQGDEGPGLRHPRATPAASARRSTR